MELSDYCWKWRAIGRQLATGLTDQETRQLEDLIDRPDEWAAATPSQWEVVADWLALPPARFEAKWKKVRAGDQLVLMVRLQYLCHLSANAARQAELFERLRGRDSRQDLAAAARAILALPTEPTTQDMKDALYG